MTKRKTGRGGSAALVAGMIALAAGAAHADTAMLGDFTPVATGVSARAGWINPAAIQLGGGSAVALETVWLDGFSSGLEPGDITFLNTAVSTNRACYAFQKNFGDVPGLADWTVTAARPMQLGARTWLGLGFEWEHGDESGFDGTLGFLQLLGPDLRLAGAVENVIESREADTRRWRAGAAWARPGTGYLSWDLRQIEGEDPENWFGLGIEKVRGIRLSFHANVDGDWVAYAGVGVPRHSLGGGMRQVDERREARFAAWEWRPHPQVHKK
jgi:hypothetical protein